MSCIAIDGVAGAGKSVLGAWLAQQLHYRYLDTGLFYRAFAWVCLRTKTDAHNLVAIKQLLQRFQCEPLTNSSQQVKINGEQIIDQVVLYQADVSTATASLAKLALVRQHLTDYFRQLVADNNYVVVGRDIGGQVLPHATVKLFITARLEVRAQRRWQQYSHSSRPLLHYRRVLTRLQSRDQQDANRLIAPLEPAADSIIFDNSDLKLPQAKTKLWQLICPLICPSARVN